MFKVLTLVGALLLGATQCAPLVMAQEFPRKQPIRVVVAAPPGAGTDVRARITAEFLQKRLGQNVIVENKPGAGSAIAADHVAKSPADGYTIFLTANEFGALPAVRKNLPYKFNDFTFLIRPFAVSPVLLGSPKLAASTTQELVTYMKANPDKIRYGNTGVGAIVHLALVLLDSAAGVKGVHIPYGGSAPIFNDMLGGNVDITQAAPPFPDGLKVLGSVGSRRNPAFPNLPTLEEIGIKGASWDLWFGFVAPPNLPRPIADKLIAELSAVFKDPEAIAKFEATTKVPPLTEPLIGEDFKRRLMEEHRDWKAVVDREKIVVE
jgi:tripartite-type tricarboxylate transporter receptor subunit TctC